MLWGVLLFLGFLCKGELFLRMISGLFFSELVLVHGSPEARNAVLFVFFELSDLGWFVPVGSSPGGRLVFLNSSESRCFIDSV